MSNTNFVNKQTTIDADWAQDVNDTIYNIIGNGSSPPLSAADVRGNIGLTASSGSSLIGFIQSGTGTPGTWKTFGTIAA